MFNIYLIFICSTIVILPIIKRVRGRSRAAATSKMECFVIIVNGWKPLTIITKHSILDVAVALDPPLRVSLLNFVNCHF